jgi:hypothetical protein
MKKLLAMMLLPLSAFAGTATLTWTAPTQYTNGTAIAAPITYRVYRGNCGAAKTLLASPAAATYVDSTAPNGSNLGYTVSAVVAGVESAQTTEMCKVFPLPVPNPPTNLTVTVAVVAGINMAPVYKLTSTGKRSADPAGFIAVNEGCTGNVLFTYRGKSFRKVDYTKVQFWATVPADNVAAPCA